LSIEHLSVLRQLELASASPRRRELLASLGLDVRVVPSAYDERPIAGLDPRALAIHHAAGKNRLAVTGSSAFVVAADTVVDVDGEALGKPVDEADARTMLRRLSGRAHRVHSAFALRAIASGEMHEACVSTTVVFADLSDTTITEYAASGDGLDKAGAYGIQGLGATLVERIEGDYFTVVGLPLTAFAQSLARFGRRLSYMPEAVAR